MKRIKTLLLLYLFVIFPILVFGNGQEGAVQSLSPSSTQISPSSPTPSPPRGYNLVWSDEFDGASLDTNKWGLYKYINGQNAWVPYNNDNNITLENGVVRIGPKSSGISTENKFEFQYGYIEIRAKLANSGNVNSYTSDLWISHETGRSIDIQECSSGPIALTGSAGRDKVNTHIHNWPFPNKRINKGTLYPTNIDLSQDYHIYAVEWTPDYVKCFFDGKEYHTFTPDPSSNFAIPSDPMYVVLSICRGTKTGHCWPATDAATVNAYMYVDYVRVYQKNNVNPLPTPTPTLTETPTPTSTPTPTLSVRVVGDQLVNGRGQAIRLVGVNFPASSGCIPNNHQPFYFFGVPSATQAAAAIAAWHANVVRIATNEDCWLGINGVSPIYSGPNYQTAIVNFVNLLHSYGIYVVVDLHKNAPGTYVANSQQVMADADHARAYWQSVAATFKNDPAVIFDAYNEPRIDTTNAQTTNPWQCWRDGCTITETDQKTDQKQNQPLSGALPWQSLGMQDIVTAIRSTGATNPIMLGGLNWAQDLSRFLQYLPTDPQNQLLASYHNYMSAGTRNTQAYWDSVIAPIAQKMPVVTGEMGESDCLGTYVNPYMAWADQHNISYIPWIWTNWSCNDYGLLSDWSGTPNSYGQIFYTHFLAISSSTPTPSPTPTPTITPPPGYKLVWTDEFDGSTLDTSKWKLFGPTTSHNITLENGVVKIGPESSGLSALNYFKYGYIEIKAKLANSGNENSFLSALWLARSTGGGSIDITETSSGPVGDYTTGWLHRGRDKVNTNIPLHGKIKATATTLYRHTDLSQDYHIYAVEWTPNYVKSFFDGKEYYTFTPDSAKIPQDPMHILLTLCRKGASFYNANCYPATDNATVDAYMYVDYVRVYQKR